MCSMRLIRNTGREIKETRWEMSKGTDSHHSAFRGKNAASSAFHADDEKLLCLKLSRSANTTHT